MHTLKITFKGKTPLLQNPMTDDQLNQLYYGAGARKGKDTRKPMEQLAAERVIRQEGTGLKGIPAGYFFACLVHAGRFVKFDSKRFVSNSKETLLPSFLSITDDFLPFLDQEVEHVMDKRRGRLKDGTAVCIVRPKFHQWAFTVTCEVDEQEISEDKVNALFEKAGRVVGLGDFRPACKGTFGMFQVVNIEKMVQAKAA